MRISTLFPLSLVIAFVAAQAPSGTDNSFNNPKGGFSFTAGQPKEIDWTPTTGGTVTIRLRQGNSNALGAGTAIAKSVPNNGKFTWTPDNDLVKGSDYALEIVDDQDTTKVNYSPQFPVDSKNTASKSASASAASSTNSAASSSASASAAKTSSASASASSASASSASASSASASASAMSSASASASSAAASSMSASMTSAGASQAAATTSSSAASTTAPNPNGAPAVKVGGSMLALVVAVFAAL